jgi:hypothetical protein
VTQLWPADSAGAAATGRPPHPGSVKAASVLLILSAWLILLPLIALVYEIVNLDDLIQRAAQRTAAGADEINTQRIATQAITGVGIGLLVLLAAAMFFPALALRRGSRGARAMSIFSSLSALLCCGGGVGLSLLGSQGSSQTTAFEKELAALSAAETPSWVEYATIAGALVPLLGLAALIALLTPAAREFFRTPEATEAGYGYTGGYFSYPAPSQYPQSWGERSDSRHSAADAPAESAPPESARAERSDSPPSWGESRPWDPPTSSDRSSDDQPRG